MAKKRSKTAARSVEIVDGGIYTRWRIDGRLQDGWGTEPPADFDYSKQLAEELEIYERVARERAGKCYTKWQQNNGRVNDSDRNEGAQSLTVLIGIDRMREVIKAGINPHALYIALRLGHDLEKLRVLPHEPDALGGKKSAKARKKGPSTRAAKSKERKAWVRAEYASVLTANPDDTAKARRLVRDAYPIRFPGETIKVGTIERYVARPRGKRRS